MDITRTITGRDNRDMVSSIGEVVSQPMGYFWHPADHGRVLISDDHDTHGYRSILVGTRGGVGPGGGLVRVRPRHTIKRIGQAQGPPPSSTPLLVPTLPMVSEPSVLVSAEVSAGTVAASFSSSASSACSARVAAI